MRIAQVAPLYEAVPPKLYGGTERVVSYLTEALVAMGHDVTLFASGDSVTSAKLVPACPRALRLDPGCRDPIAHHTLLIERVMAAARGFDVLHFHCDTLHFPFSRRSPTPTLTTLHGRLDLADLQGLFGEFTDIPLCSISHSQRRPLPGVAWRGTVHHGLPVDLLPFSPRPAGYLAFLGRVSPEKGVPQAIDIALRTGLPLKLAAKIDPNDGAFFDQVVRPRLDHPLVTWVGEIGEADKAAFLGGAMALLFPIRWPEPFGLVMIEAMACGTPVVAFRCGAVPEVIDDGVSGFVVDDVDQAVAAIGRLAGFDRRRCRATFERRFSDRRMAGDYLALYRRLARRAELSPVA